MANSGPNGTPLRRPWPPSLLPVIAWRVWVGTNAQRITNEDMNWDDLPDEILAVAVYHHFLSKVCWTWMRHVDIYTPPPGWGSLDKLGLQVGEVDGLEWMAMKEVIKADVGVGL